MNWESIYIKEAPKLLAVCRRYVQDLQKAEDLMHDAFLTAIKKQDQYAGKGAIGAWLRRVTVNTVLMYLRKKKGVLELLDKDIEKPISPFEDTEPHDKKGLILAAGFESSDLLAAIDILPAHHKIVFNLYVFEEFTHKEIGQKLNISSGTSKSHLARARKKIQKILAEKAIEMKKKNKRAGIIPFLFGKDKEFYLDDMFREDLQKNPLAPQGNIPADLQNALKSNPPITIPTKWLGLKPALLSSLVIALIGTIAFFSVTKDAKVEADNSPIIISKDTGENSLKSTNLLQEDIVVKAEEKSKKEAKTTSIQQKKQRQVVDSLAPKKAKLPPVIIKKSVILRDTVFEITTDETH